MELETNIKKLQKILGMTDEEFEINNQDNMFKAIIPRCLAEKYTVEKMIEELKKIPPSTSTEVIDIYNIFQEHMWEKDVWEISRDTIAFQLAGSNHNKRKEELKDFFKSLKIEELKQLLAKIKLTMEIT